MRARPRRSGTSVGPKAKGRAARPIGLSLSTVESSSKSQSILSGLVGAVANRAHILEHRTRTRRRLFCRLSADRTPVAVGELNGAWTEHGFLLLNHAV